MPQGIESAVEDLTGPRICFNPGADEEQELNAYFDIINSARLPPLTKTNALHATAFRCYEPDNLHDVNRQCVMENYRLNHTHQTVDFVTSMHAKHLSTEKGIQLGVWDAIQLLDAVVDDSDPDTDMSQLEHLLQTAEACRKTFPQHEWLAVTGLVHDLGKLLALDRFGGEPQWAVVGDTFPVGCAHDGSVVFHELFKGNPDVDDAKYNTPLGMYSHGCGFDNVLMSWGHDEYLYRVLCRTPGVKLPEEGLYIIRYHSFYAWHQAGAYAHLASDMDRRMLPWLKAFQRCDLYSKTDERIDVGRLASMYKNLCAKYFPIDLKW